MRGHDSSGGSFMGVNSFRLQFQIPLMKLTEMTTAEIEDLRTDCLNLEMNEISESLQKIPDGPRETAIRFYQRFIPRPTIVFGQSTNPQA